MSVTIINNAGDEFTFESGTKWTVDNFGHLHVIGGSGDGTVATYSATKWESVRSV